MSERKKLFPVVVTTEHRGVFFGYVDALPESCPNEITLAEARMCVYWSEDVKGVVGLAATGPSGSCKITPATPKQWVNAVTSVMLATANAAEKWKSAPWS